MLCDIKKNIFLLIWSLELINPYHKLLHNCHASSWRPHHPDFEIFDGLRLTQPLNQACLWGLYNPSLSAAKCRPCHRQQFQTVFLQGNLLIPGNFNSWWRHQMETFSALLALCAGNSPVSGEFPAQRPVTRIFDVFFDLRLIKRLSKHSLGWRFETLSRPLWRHCNVNTAEPFYKHDKGNPRWWPFKRGGLSWGLK